MSLQLPPTGTYGPEIPKFARRMMRMTSGIGTLMFRLGVKVQGRPLLVLTTVGARSGKKRTTVLGWFPAVASNESWIVVASAAGSARHPGWAYNLAKHPDRATVDAGDGPIDVGADLLTGVERDDTWARVVELAPGYGSYTAKTDRELPLFRLRPLAKGTPES